MIAFALACGTHHALAFVAKFRFDGTCWVPYFAYGTSNKMLGQHLANSVLFFKIKKHCLENEKVKRTKENILDTSQPFQT